MIDRSGRLFGRVNLLDLLVVLLIIAFVARLAFTWWVQKPTVAESQQTITMTVLVEGVRQPTVQNVNVGDIVYDTRSNALLGKVVAVKSQPADVTQVMDDGSRVETQSKVKSDLYVTVRGPGRATPTAVVFGSLQIHIGTQIQIETRIWGVLGTVWGIQVGGASQ